MTLHHITKDIQRAADPRNIKRYQTYFKDCFLDKKDRFLGVPLPAQKKIANRHKEVDIKDIQKLLKSDIHEYRMVGGLVLAKMYKDNPSEELIEFYLKNIRRFNSWDLVDATCDRILGNYLADKKKKRSILHDFSKSTNLWERRVSIMSTFQFIKQKQYVDTLKIAEQLLSDKTALTQAAVGGMLYEIAKRDRESFIRFLKKNNKKISKVTLGVALERIKPNDREAILSEISK